MNATVSTQEAAILFADVKGYSVLIQRDEVGTYHRLQQARALFRRLAGDYGGRIVDEAGDGVLAAFTATGHAIDFALEVQRDLASAAAWQGEAGPFAFRIGLHAGPVHLDGERLFGRNLIVAQRIQEITPPGAVCASEQARLQVASRADLRFVSLGWRSLKNLEPMLVHRVEAADQLSILDQSGTGVISPGWASDEASIAMLPLENHSPDTIDRALCDGVTIDIIDRLCRFRDLLVIARHSAFQCRELADSPAEVGQLLGVRYLALGTMRRAGNRLRITAQLIESESGRLLWSDRYDGALSDVFAFQDDVADTVAARLAVQVSAAERRRLLTAHAPPVSAYAFHLRGQDLLFRYRADSNSHARRLFEEAVAIDPTWGRLYAGLSRTFNLGWRYRWEPNVEQCLDRAMELALEAVSRDELDARGFAELGFVHLYRRMLEPALKAYEHALELNPNDADVLAEMGDALNSDGQSERAVQVLRRATRLNPSPPDWYLWYLGGALFDLKRYAEVVSTVSSMRDPTEGRRLLAASCAYLGRSEEAGAHAQAVLRAHPNFSTAEWRQVAPIGSKEKLDHYLEGLRLAGLP
jgi:TolB-like protein/class 3 adenylate cyclase/tetratricopeptide (TPR) repeat protein